MLEVDRPPVLSLSLAAVRGKSSKKPDVCYDQVVIGFRFHLRRSAHSDISNESSVCRVRM